MKSPVNTKHIVGIDALRFIAALMVVFFHFGFLLAADPGARQNFASQHLIAYPETRHLTYFGFVGVQIFFVISGFVIAFSGEKATAFQFFASRVTRLGPGVWICATLTLIATMVVGFNASDETARYLRSIFFAPFGGSYIDDSYWTLGVEIAFYSMVFLLICINRFSWVRYLAVTIGIASIIFTVGLTVDVPVLSKVVHASQKWSRLPDLALFNHGMFFAIGVFLWLELIKKPQASNSLWLALFIAAGCFQIYTKIGSVNHYENGSYSGLTAVVVWLAAIVAIAASVKLNSAVHKLPQSVLRAAQTAGLMTYPLYLIHQTAGNAVIGMLVWMGMARWPALALGVLVVLISAWIIAVYAEPALQRLTRSALYRVRALVLRQPYAASKGAPGPAVAQMDKKGIAQ